MRTLPLAIIACLLISPYAFASAKNSGSFKSVTPIKYHQGLRDTLSWRILERSGGSFSFATGDSAAMWFKPISQCTLKAIRIHFDNFAGNILLDIFESRYDGHITTIDSTDVNGFVGTHENGQWEPGDVLGHSPIGDYLWGPFPLTVTPENDYSWVEVSAVQIGEIDLGKEPFFVGMVIFPLEETGRIISMENEGIIPYHFFKYYYDCCGPDGIHNGWFLRKYSLWVEVIVSYYGNTPPKIVNMDVLNDTYDPGPYEVTAKIEDSDITRPEKAGVAGVFLHWDVFGCSDSVAMSGPSENGFFTANIPAIGIGDRIEYYITAIDSSGAKSENTHRFFSRINPENPDADILLIDYGYGFELSEYWPVVIESLSYAYELWSAQAHNGIDASVMGYGWSTIIPFGQYRLNEPVIPTKGYEGHLWADFLQSGSNEKPVNLFHVAPAYFNLNHDYNPKYEPGDFAYDFFGIDSATTDYGIGGEKTIYGVTGDPVSGGFAEEPFRHTWPLDWFHQYWFEYTSANERGSDLFFTSAGKGTGVRCNGGRFKTVFLPWEVEYILEIAETDTVPGHDFRKLVGNILEWFGTETMRTAIENHMVVPTPKRFTLCQNYPNPFNAETDIRYQISDTRLAFHITLKIYNILGQEVRTLVDEIQHPGYFTITWDGRDETGGAVASGVYFYQLSVDGDYWTRTKRMVLLK